MNLPKLAQYLEENSLETFLIFKEYQASQDAKLDKVLRELADERQRADQAWVRWESQQGMADCMHMVRQEFIEAGLIDESVAPMFVTDAVLRKIHEVQLEANRFAACRHQARHMQEDGGESAFVAQIDVYRKKNGI